MKERQRGGARIDNLTALALFGAFSLCVLAVLLAGAGTYQRIVERDKETYDLRTTSQYLTTKVRQCPGTVRVEPFQGESCLVLTELIEGQQYATRIYCSEGWLRELFSEETLLPQGDEGEKVLPAQSLQAHVDADLLSLRLELGTQSCFLSLALPHKEGSP